MRYRNTIIEKYISTIVRKATLLETIEAGKGYRKENRVNKI
jgi:hypothetical protein